MKSRVVIALLALAACAAAQEPPPPEQLPPPPPIAVTNVHPPPVVAVPSPAPLPVLVPNAPLWPQAAPAPPPNGARIVRPPQARRPLQQLVSADDYPPSALRLEEEGRVAFALDVAANGRATGCTVTASSGSRALDAVTCRLMRSRARFTPAIDSNGMPAAARMTGEVEWSLPEEGEERG